MTADVARRESVSLVARDVHQTLGGNKVLRGVDIEAAAGSTVAVIGPSGSGKSTLLRTLNRLNEPDSGDILLDGRSVLRAERSVGRLTGQKIADDALTARGDIGHGFRKLSVLAQMGIGLVSFAHFIVTL